MISVVSWCAVHQHLSIPLFIAASLFPCGVSGQGPDLARVEKLVVDGTNQFRRSEGVGAVEADARLAKAARYFAQYMARTDTYSHDADGSRPSERARSHGYDYCLVSENISYQYSSADFGTGELAGRYLDGWKSSPGHRKNMLAAAATDTAVAVARSEKTGRYYAVQMFGRPKSEAIEFEVTNSARDAVRYRVADRTFELAPRATRIHQQCGPEDIALVAMGDGQRGNTSLRAGNGDRFAIVGRPGDYQLKGFTR